MLDDLNDFISSNPDARELKRAVAVQMFLKGYKHREIGESIGVSSGFISKWTQFYEQLGVSRLKLGYSGSLGYLEPEQRQAVIAWLKSKNYWNLVELQMYIEQEYEVVFDSTTACLNKLGLAGRKPKSAIQKQTPNW
jgi:putative transposase